MTAKNPLSRYFCDIKDHPNFTQDLCKECPRNKTCSHKQVDELDYMEQLGMLKICRYYDKPELEYIYTVITPADKVETVDINGRKQKYIRLEHTGVHAPKKNVLASMRQPDCEIFPDYAVCWAVTTNAQYIKQEDLEAQDSQEKN